MAAIKAWADRHLERFLSRKLLVAYDKIDGEQFVAISLAYIGSQGIADIATAWKSGQILSKDV